MSSVKNGDTVTINYVGKLEDGQVFATTSETVAKEEGIYSSGLVGRRICSVDVNCSNVLLG